MSSAPLKESDAIMDNLFDTAAASHGNVAGVDDLFEIAVFASITAKTCAPRTVTLREIEALARHTTAPSKAKLPLLKLALFGVAPSERGSLRHDDNVVGITGIEGDYDGGVMSFDAACAALSGVLALVYTTPSHTPDAPRWRVVCPTSRTLRPDERRQWVDALDARLGNILSPESRALSQIYYFGCTNTAEHHATALLDGAPIDTLPQPTLARKGSKANGAAPPAAADGGRDTSRSGIAWHVGRAARRAGADFVGMTAAIRAHSPALANWCDEKNVERQLKRIFVSEPDTIADALYDCIQDINKTWMVVNDGNRIVVFEETPDGHYDWLTFDDFKRKFMNRLICTGRKKDGLTFRKVGDAWLEHSNRREYDRVVFDPSESTCRAQLNLFKGFAHPGAPGDWSMLREHIRVIACNGDAEHFDYFMKWLANMVQRPDRPGEVAIVLKGAQGAGKGVIAKFLMTALGNHTMHLSSPDELVGKFNSQLRSTIFLFADEAFYAGDKAHLGALNRIITEPTLRIEGKYKNAIKAPNHLHIMMASNADWVVPATIGARRFFVLNVSDARRQDIVYFKAMNAQMESGGYAAMMFELTALSLIGFDVQTAPVTDGLREQQDHSLPTIDAWWRDCLARGYVHKHRDDPTLFGAWPDRASTAVLHASYLAFADKRRERHPLKLDDVGRYMVAMGCCARRFFEMLEWEKPFAGPATPAKTRPHGYLLGTLEAARDAFSRLRGGTSDWTPGYTAQNDEPAGPTKSGKPTAWG